MKNRLKIIMPATFLIINGCSSLPKAPGEADLTVAKTKWEDVKMEDLSAGHTIYTTRCNKCHGLKPISTYDETTWGKIIDGMAPKAKLNESETKQLRQYIYSARGISK